ncbi:hypothetical protein B0T20DRAFT_467115 [Sordaria brevicollis]|uniref:non-specific serine/threonine protein kinase n=1 Tax=Sordaria brevicollis TaxID=83679 RepID=A0AAE0PLR8_SORBR|nr:hypothetical protein B0T20DRAFT_467115 [Sordaria brevicollis]
MTSPPTPPPPPSSFLPLNSTTPLYTTHKHLSPGTAILIRRSTDGSILLGTPSPSSLLSSSSTTSTTTTTSPLPIFSPPSLSPGSSPHIIRELMKGRIQLEATPFGGGGRVEGIGAPEAAARILNHENLVSLHGEWVSAVVDGVGHILGGGAGGETKDKTERWLVWDWCDAGTVKGLVEFYGGGVAERVIWGVVSSEQGGNGEGGKKKGGKGKKKKEELGTVLTRAKPSTVKQDVGFLPESLIWHVALGVLRALMFLHEGKRDVISVERDPVTGGFKRVRTVQGPPETEPDWLPILHRDVRAENIYLQHPRGIETYGPVKLGGFENCYVSAAVVMAADEEEQHERIPLVALERDAIGGTDEIELRDRWLEWQEDREEVEYDKRPYTRGCDLYALGTILYHMMTGHALPPVPEDCPLCGCHHIQFYFDRKAEKKCTHRDCDYEDVNAEVKLGWLINTGSLGKYSKNLAGLVGLLLRQYRSDEMRASELLDRIAWKAYEEWKTTTPDGKLYKDATDDMVFRKNNEIVAKRNLVTAQLGGMVEDVYSNSGE